MKGVSLNSDGQCVEQTIQVTKTGFSCKRKKLFVQADFADLEILILSTHDIEDLGDPSVSLSMFPLPPPLNHYIYPDPIFFLGGNVSNPKDLTCDEMIEKCARCKASIQKHESSITVYDVPLNEETYEEANESEEDEAYEQYLEEDDEDDVEEEDFSDVDDDDAVIV